MSPLGVILNRKALWIAGVALIAYFAIQRQILTVSLGLEVLAAIIALVLHEISHGLVALYYGDHTAAKSGRLRLNPLAHIDPFGTLILPAILLLMHLSPIGYAKPVPIDPNKLRHRNKAMLVIALAGPFTNLLLSIIAGIALRIFVYSNSYSGNLPLLNGLNNSSTIIGYFWIYFGIINAIYFVFNMLPIPPLDGSAILRRVIGEAGYHRVASSMKIFIPILLLLIFIFPTLLSQIFNPVIKLWIHLFLPASAIA